MSQNLIPIPLVSKNGKKVRKINGTDISSHIQHLTVQDEILTTPEQIGKKLGQQFSFNSSSENFTQEFERFKAQAEKLTYNI